MNDPYGSFHLAFNEDPHPSKATRDRGPLSEWLNMGYWKVWRLLSVMFNLITRHQDTDKFPEACEGMRHTIV